MKAQLQHPTRLPQIRSTYFTQWMDAIRETLYCRVTYTSELNGLTHLAQGWIRDFSHTDCAIRGRLLPPIGSATTLTVHLRDGDPPVSCDGNVSWTASGALVCRFDQCTIKIVHAYSGTYRIFITSPRPCGDRARSRRTP
jgi:hypothetical protein